MSFPTTQFPVLWLDFDNGKDRTDERLSALAKARGLSQEVPLHYVSMPSPWLDASDEDQMRDLENRIKQLGAKLVIVDNLCVVSGSVEENSAAMGTVMANWRRLAEKLRIAIIIIHHQRKGNGNQGRAGDSLRGHSSIEASLDLALQVERKGQSDIIRINPTKVRGADVASFGALFTYTHVPGTDILETARFFGHAAVNSSGNQSIEAMILTVLRTHIETYSPPNKTTLAVKVKEAINGKPGHKAAVGLNRIRATIEALASTDKLSVSKGKGTEKLYDLPSNR